MTFTTPTFFVFLIVVFVIYWRLDRTAQNRFILFASLVFYGWWDWRFLGLLAFTAGVDFWVALRLDAEADARRRRALLGISLASNLGVLVLFKYANFFIASGVASLGKLGFSADPPLLNVILPLGISFYTFQALSYTIDVYRRQLPATRDPVAYFGFICFFPHMVAGPIQRAVHLLVQFDVERRFDYDEAVDGSRQMLWGFYKKMVIADNLAPFVNAAYANAAYASGWELWWATVAFSIQIYCDFSGYTDIAIGCARLFGFRLTRNFAYPYFARSITDFWRRWHISLSTWFREYVYIPLGGNRGGLRRMYLNVMIVFAVSGLWHGANWTFLAWGIIHGVLYVAYGLARVDERLAASTATGLVRIVRDIAMGLVTYVLVCFAWIFFRAVSLSDAVTIVTRIARSVVSEPVVAPPYWRFLALAALLLAVEWVHRRYEHGLEVRRFPLVARWVIYYGIAGLLFWKAYLEHVPFIYFQF